MFLWLVQGLFMVDLGSIYMIICSMRNQKKRESRKAEKQVSKEAGSRKVEKQRGSTMEKQRSKEL